MYKITKTPFDIFRHIGPGFTWGEDEIVHLIELTPSFKAFLLKHALMKGVYFISNALPEGVSFNKAWASFGHKEVTPTPIGVKFQSNALPKGVTKLTPLRQASILYNTPQAKSLI